MARSSEAVRAEGITRLAQRASAALADNFGGEPEWTIWAPGRVNLIGEHVDYNAGLVLPIAMDRGLVLAARRSVASHRVVRLYSEQLGQSASFSLDELRPSTHRSWWSHIAGVFVQFSRLNIHGSRSSALREWIGEWDLSITSNLPMGAGLSSSAAICAATAILLDHCIGLRQTPIEMARLCQQAEHEFAGVPCGLMDPLSVIAGKANHCMLLDCKSDRYEHIRMDDASVSLLIADTGVSRELSAGHYASRRRQCEQAAAVLEVPALRDASIEQLQIRAPKMPQECVRRARHVIREIVRAENAAICLKTQDWPGLGRLFNESHASLRDEFEVSCAELDTMVELATSMNGVLGARMIGGGFGGSVLALVETDSLDEVISQLAAEYQRRTGKVAECFPVYPSGGARVL